MLSKRGEQQAAWSPAPIPRHTPHAPRHTCCVTPPHPLVTPVTPAQVGDEIVFFHNNKTVEGFVIDIGWYRTNVRSWEREVYVIPNAVFSKVGGGYVSGRSNLALALAHPQRRLLKERGRVWYCQ